MPMNPRLLVPRAAGGFDPRTISGLAVWLDPSNTASLTYNSTTISQINDGSGNGRHFVQSTAGSQPGTTTVNGRTALVFDGKWMRQTALSAYANRTLLIVLSRRDGNNATNVGAIFGYRSSASAISGVSDSDRFFQLRADGALSGTPTGFDTLNTATVSAWTNGASASFGAGTTLTQRFSTCAFATAGAVAIVAANSTQTQSGNKMPLLGVEGNSSTRTYGMTFCELLVYSVELSASERQKIERYLGKKWGVTVA